MPNWLHNAIYYAVCGLIALALFVFMLCVGLFAGLAWGIVAFILLAVIVYVACSWLVNVANYPPLAIPGWLLLAFGLVAGLVCRWVF